MKCVSHIKVADTEEMVSFDVRALYTSLPLTRTIDVVRKRLEEDDSWTHGTPLQSSHIVELLDLCLTSTYFSFQDRFYWIKDGVAMGSPVSSVVANIFSWKI